MTVFPVNLGINDIYLTNYRYRCTLYHFGLMVTCFRNAVLIKKKKIYLLHKFSCDVWDALNFWNEVFY